VSEYIAEIDFNGKQFFVLGEIVGGTFGTGQGVEHTDNEKAKGSYIPMWIDINDLSYIDVKTKEAADKIQSVFNKFFEK
jgi:hypothetical protein